MKNLELPEGTVVYFVGVNQGHNIPSIEQLVVSKTKIVGRQCYVIFKKKPKLQEIWPSRGFIERPRWDWEKIPKGIALNRTILAKQISLSDNERGYFFLDNRHAINRIEHMALMLEKKHEVVLEKLADYKVRIDLLRREFHERTHRTC